MSLEKQFSEIRGVIESLEKECVSLRKSLLGSQSKIMEVKPIKEMGRLQFIQYYTDDNRYRADNTIEKVCERALKHAEDLFTSAKKIHENNIEAIENNKLIRSSIAKFMESLGISSLYKTYQTKYVRNKPKTTSDTQYAGWYQDMNRCVIIDDNFESEQKKYENRLVEIEKYRKEETEKLEKKLADERKAKDKQKLEEARAVFIIKYGVAYDANWQQVIDRIIRKDSRLLFAHYMDLVDSYNRSFFSELRDECDQFVPQNEDEKKLKDGIDNNISNWTFGESSFKEGEYSIESLFALVKNENPDLYNDYCMVDDHIESYKTEDEE